MAAQDAKLTITDAHYAQRYEIRQELRKRGLVRGKTPKTIEALPADMRHMFEMRRPDFILAL